MSNFLEKNNGMPPLYKATTDARRTYRETTDARHIYPEPIATTNHPVVSPASVKPLSLIPKKPIKINNTLKVVRRMK